MNPLNQEFAENMFSLSKVTSSTVGLAIYVVIIICDNYFIHIEWKDAYKLYEWKAKFRKDEQRNEVYSIFVNLLVNFVKKKPKTEKWNVIITHVLNMMNQSSMLCIFSIDSIVRKGLGHGS